jgi:outer membrane protein assembly factor BamB
LIDLPVAWTAKDCAWKASLPGTGSSSPVLWGQKLFLLCGDNGTGTRTVVCLSANDGSTVWKREYGAGTFAKNRDNSYASSTAAADQRHVYIYCATPEEVSVLALDHSGVEVWRRNLGPYKSQHGGGTSPIVFGDLVIFNNDQDGESFLIALDTKNGATRWQLDRRTDRAAYATPCIRQTAENKPELVFASSSHGVTAVDPLKGAVNWEFTNAFPFRVVSSPALARDLIIGTCGEGGAGRRLVAVRPGANGRAAQLAYELKNSIPYVPTPLVLGDLLFLWCDNGLVACHRAATGERIWQHKISDAFYSSPVCAAGRLYGISKTGVVYVFAANEKPELLSTIPLGEPSFATPAIGNGAIYFRTESHLFCLRAPRG